MKNILKYNPNLNEIKNIITDCDSIYDLLSENTLENIESILDIDCCDTNLTDELVRLADYDYLAIFINSTEYNCIYGEFFQEFVETMIHDNPQSRLTNYKLEGINWFASNK